MPAAEAKPKVIIAGASGLVGYAALKHYAGVERCQVVALSRRAPRDAMGAAFAAVDLTDAEACRAFAAAQRDATHLVYAAVQEQPSLIAGWRDETQIATNAQMLRNLLDPLAQLAPGLRHVTLMQGLKAYGAHVKQPDIPAREGRSEMVEQPNFYWKQEAYLRELQKNRPWRWTILRPGNIFGEALASSLNPIPAIGVYGAVLKARGEPLHFTGGALRIIQAVDADLLARCIAWAGRTPAAENEIFNISNGDVFTWSGVWPAIADALGMAPGEHRPLALGEAMRSAGPEWDAVREKHALLSPDIDSFVGMSFQYLDYTFCHGKTETGSSIGSNVKLRQAGFHEHMDTEQMFRKWFAYFQERRLLPPRMAS